MPRGGKREGAGRPVGAKTVNRIKVKKHSPDEYTAMSIRILKEDAEQIRQRAKEAGKNTSAYCVDILLGRN